MLLRKGDDPGPTCQRSLPDVGREPSGLKRVPVPDRPLPEPPRAGRPRRARRQWSSATSLARTSSSLSSSSPAAAAAAGGQGCSSFLPWPSSATTTPFTVLALRPWVDLRGAAAIARRTSPPVGSFTAPPPPLAGAAAAEGFTGQRRLGRTFHSFSSPVHHSRSVPPPSYFPLPYPHPLLAEPWA